MARLLNCFFNKISILQKVIETFKSIVNFTTVKKEAINGLLFE